MASGVATSVFGALRILDDMMHALVSGVIWDQLRDAMMWMQLLCNPATLQPVSLWGEGTRGGAEFSRGPWLPGHPLEPPLCCWQHRWWAESEAEGCDDVRPISYVHWSWINIRHNAVRSSTNRERPRTVHWFCPTTFGICTATCSAGRLSSCRLKTARQRNVCQECSSLRPGNLCWFTVININWFI